MRRTPRSRVLFNTPQIELWPADLLRARSNHDARLLARATRVLRRKRDGRYLAAAVPEGLVTLLPGWQRDTRVDEALDLLDVERPPAAEAAAAVSYTHLTLPTNREV